MDKIKIVDDVLTAVEYDYGILQANLMTSSQTRKTEGETRRDAGNLIEGVLQTIFDTINESLPENEKIISIVGKNDTLSRTLNYKGQTIVFGSIQVDRHIWQLNKRIAFIENKTYLDSCYYDRALADFKKIAQALKQSNSDPANVCYIVFAGQKAASDNTLLAYEADFWHDTKSLTSNENGIVPHTFYFLQGIRSSGKPLYKNKHNLNFDEIKKFTNLILDLIS